MTPRLLITYGGGLVCKWLSSVGLGNTIWIMDKLRSDIHNAHVKPPSYFDDV